MTIVGIPDLAGRGLLAWRIAWLGALAAALAVQIAALFEVDRPTALTALGLAQGGVLVAVAFLLFRRRPHDPVAAMLSLAFLLWAITGAAHGDSIWIAAIDRVRFLLLVAAVLLFPSGRFEPRWTLPVLAVSILVFLVGLAGLTGWLPERWFLPPAVLCVMAAILSLLVRLHRAPPCGRRQQLIWVAFGLAAGLVLILAYRLGSAFAPPNGAAFLLLEATFRAGVMLMALGFLISLLRYRLYDAEAAISRSAAYLALTLSLLAIFAASEATIELIGQRYLGMQVGDLAGGTAAAIAAVLIAPLHEHLSRWAEQRFQRDLVVLREDLPALLADVREQVDMNELAAILLPRLEEGVRASYAALALDGGIIAVNGVAMTTAAGWFGQWSAPEPRGPLDRDPSDPLFPLRIPLSAPGSSLFGWVLLGPRPDASFYRVDELEALAAIAAPLRRAIIAVRRRERHAAVADAFQNGLQISLASLMGRVAALEQAANMRILHGTHSEPEVGSTSRLSDK